MTRTHSPRSTSHNSRVPSSLPLSRWRLSGVKASPFTAAAGPCSPVKACPAFPCHSRIVWSKLPLATVRPSGLQATHCTCSVWPSSVWRRRTPSPSSHSLTLPSQLALARLVPSGAKASPRTQLLCPARLSTQAALPWDGISHSRMVPATSPLASRRPSGLQASEVNGPTCGTSARGVPCFVSHSLIVASCPPLASTSPSGAKARQSMPLVCQPDQRAIPLSTSHSLTLPSRLPLESRRSSGLNARAQTASLSSGKPLSNLSPFSRPTRTLPCLPPVAPNLPLGLIATAVLASKASVKTHSRSLAPASVVSCISTPSK